MLSPLTSPFQRAGCLGSWEQKAEQRDDFPGLSVPAFRPWMSLIESVPPLEHFPREGHPRKGDSPVSGKKRKGSARYTRVSSSWARSRPCAVELSALRCRVSECVACRERRRGKMALHMDETHGRPGDQNPLARRDMQSPQSRRLADQLGLISRNLTTNVQLSAAPFVLASRILERICIWCDSPVDLRKG